MYYIYKNNMENLILRSGLGESDNSSSDIDQKIHITSLLTIFMENSVKTAGLYVKYCGRKTVSAKDISMALKRQLFVFLDTENLLEKAQKISDEDKKELEEQLTSDEDEDYEEDNGSEENEEHPDTESDEELNTDNMEDYDKEEAKKIYNEINEYCEKWKTWEPTNQIEQILYDGILKIDSQFDL